MITLQADKYSELKAKCEALELIKAVWDETTKGFANNSSNLERTSPSLRLSKFNGSTAKKKVELMAEFEMFINTELITLVADYIDHSEQNKSDKKIKILIKESLLDYLAEMEYILDVIELLQPVGRMYLEYALRTYPTDLIIQSLEKYDGDKLRIRKIK